MNTNSLKTLIKLLLENDKKISTNVNDTIKKMDEKISNINPIPGQNDGKILESISVSKVKTSYNVDDIINVDDITVTAFYKGDISENVDDFQTNISELDTFTEGLRLLRVFYTHNGITKEKIIQLTVSFTNTADNIQYAYCVNRNGILENGKDVLQLTNKLLKRSIVNIRYKLKVVVEKNRNSNYTTIGLGNYGIWKQTTIGSKILSPKEIGEFVIEENSEFEYGQANLPATDKPIILKLYHNGNNKIEGTFELLEYSISVTTEAPFLLESISAIKEKTRYFSNENINTDDIIVTATYSDDTTIEVKDWTSFIQDISSDTHGDIPMTITYSQNDINKSATINLKLYKADLTEPMDFIDETVWDVNNKIKYGFNLGNALDSRANTKHLFGEDAYLNQEMAWGQPAFCIETFTKLKEYGFDSIRIPVSWFYNSYIGNDKKRHIGKYFAARVREVIDYAYEAGFQYIILNSHWDEGMFYGGTTSTQLEIILADIESIWTDIAEKFKHYDNRLIFEGFNELPDKNGIGIDKAYIQVNQMNQKFVDTVRKTGSNNSKRILTLQPILVPGDESGMLNGFIVPNDTIKDKFIFQLHCYSLLYLQDIESKFSQFEKWSDEHNVPFLLGEWGTNNQELTSALRVIHAHNFVSRAKRHNLKTFWWDNGSNYMIYLRPNYINKYEGSREDIIEAIKTGYSSGTAYAIPDNKLVEINSMDQCQYGYDNGFEEIDYNFWGALDTNAIPVVSGDSISVSLNVSGNAVNDKIYLHSVNYYDSNKEKLSSINIEYGKTIYTGTIPEDACYARISIHSPHNNIKQETFNNYFLSNELSISIEAFNINDISEVELPVRELSSIHAVKITTNYSLNDIINTDDITVTATYNDGYKKNISNFITNASSISTSTKGLKILTISYTENDITKTFNISITVGGALINGISAKKIKTTYIVGDVINLNDLVVNATYTDSTSTTITGYTTNLKDISTNEVGDKTLTISYTEDGLTFTTSIIISVIVAPPTYVTWSAGESIPTQFTLGSKLGVDKEGYICNTTNANGTSQSDRQLIYSTIPSANKELTYKFKICSLNGGEFSTNIGISDTKNVMIGFKYTGNTCYACYLDPSSGVYKSINGTTINADTWYEFKIVVKNEVLKITIFDDNGNILLAETECPTLNNSTPNTNVVITKESTAKIKYIKYIDYEEH